MPWLLYKDFRTSYWYNTCYGYCIRILGEVIGTILAMAIVSREVIGTILAMAIVLGEAFDVTVAMAIVLKKLFV